MNISAISKTALTSMKSNKLRTFLTVLGMVIGIASIIIVFSAGAGINGLLVNQLNSYGTNILETEIKVPSNKSTANSSQSGMSMAQGTQITTLTLDDLEKINQLGNIKDSYAGVIGQDQISFGDQRKKITLFGTNASYVNIDSGKVATGRFFSDEEDRSLARLIVVGSKIKEDLFGDAEAVGQDVQVGKLKYKIIGVMEKRGGGMGMDFDSYVYIPIRTLQKKVLGINYVMYFINQLKDTSQADSTADEIRSLLRQRHDINSTIDSKTGLVDTSKDDFNVITMEEMVKTLNTITNAITILLLAIVVISLIVGGVGIMNIMYVIVSERTREIGLRKAVGAKFFDIMGQFLIESIYITILGAIIGIILGIGGSFLIALGAKAYGLDWSFIIPLKAFIVSILFSLIFGIAFGLFPARKAAKMDPITALRNE